MPYFYDIALLYVLDSFDKMNHCFVKVTQVVITQFFIVYQIPLAASVFIRPSVTFTREVDPFRMTEFISHKVQITAVDSRSCEQTNHFVQCYTALYDSIFITFLEVPVHIRINQTENDSLVAYQSLVVTFAVRDCFFVFTAIGYFPEQARRLPVFITTFLDNFYPIIRNVHRHTIVEAVTSVVERCGKSRHT